VDWLPISVGFTVCSITGSVDHIWVVLGNLFWWLIDIYMALKRFRVDFSLFTTCIGSHGPGRSILRAGVTGLRLRRLSEEKLAWFFSLGLMT